MLWKCFTKVESKLLTLHRKDLFLFRKWFEYGGCWLCYVCIRMNVYIYIYIYVNECINERYLLLQLIRRSPSHSTKKFALKTLYYWIFSVIKYLLLLCRLTFSNLFLQSEDYLLLTEFLQIFFIRNSFWYLMSPLFPRSFVLSSSSHLFSLHSTTVCWLVRVYV